MKENIGSQNMNAVAGKQKDTVGSGIWAPWIVLSVFFISGMAGLIYQIVWSRYLHMVFGISIHAVAAVVAAYMAGLALGSAILGKRADHMRDPLRFYGILELLIGLYAIITPFLFTLVEKFYILVASQTGITSLAANFARLGGSFVVLIIPTFLMGGTLPVMVRACMRNRENVGESTGLLYAVNTLGAMFGCYITGFIFIRTFGLWKSSFIAIGINILAAALAFAISTRYTPIPPLDKTKRRTAKTPLTMLERLVLIGYGLSGMAALAYEVLWIRALKHIFGTTTYAFTTVLSAFLAGIGLGSLAVAKYADKNKKPVLLFSMVQIFIGVSALICVPLINKIHVLSSVWLRIFGNNSWWSTHFAEFGIVFTIMLVPTLLMGATLPLVMRVFAGGKDETGTRVGLAYAYNTVGSIIGSLAAGFLMVPLFGIRLSLNLVVILNVLVGVVIIMVHPAKPRKWQACSIILLIGILASTAAMKDNRPIILSKDMFQNSAYKLLYSSEKADGTLGVVENPRSPIGVIRGLFVDGTMTAANEYQDMQIHDLLAHLGLLIHPDPRQALIVGFGLGVTPWGTTQHDNVSVDCVELMRDETNTAQYFEKENHGVLKTSRLNLIIGDGRDYIKVTDKKYDMVSFNAVHPVVSPALYTVEFYEEVKKILTDDGIIIGWLTSTSMNEDEYKGLIKSFIDVFPHTSLWYNNPVHMILMGTKEPLNIDLGSFKPRFEQPKICHHQ